MEDTDFFNDKLSPKERDLYDRQFRLNGWNQGILKNSRVLIAGVGGLGCEVAKNLAMVGVGTLDLLDMDVIEHTNLNRQILFVEGNVGEPKATVAAQALKRINPFITITGHYTSLERLDPAIYRKAHVIVGGLDSAIARLNLNAQAVRFKIPLVDGGVAGYNGHVYTIMPGENACYECYPPSAVRSDEMAACTVVGNPRKRVHCVFKATMLFKDKFHADPNSKDIKHVTFLQDEANKLVRAHNFPPEFTKGEIVKIIDRHEPGIITVNAIIASLQSHETIKLLNWRAGNDKLGKPVTTYQIINAMTMKVYHVEKMRNPKCRQCGDQVKRIDIDIKGHAKCAEIINALLRMGFTKDPEMEPTLTINDFNSVKIVDTDLTAAENELRNLELLTAGGFKEGEIFITLKLN
nr:ThiF family adenylyltransferase [Candidatus Sigynarchaeota archaeon]